MRSRRVRVHGTGPLMRMFPLFRLELRVRRSAVVEKWVQTYIVVYNETNRSEHRLRHLIQYPAHASLDAAHNQH